MAARAPRHAARFFPNLGLLGSASGWVSASPASATTPRASPLCCAKPGGKLRRREKGTEVEEPEVEEDGGNGDGEETADGGVKAHRRSRRGLREERLK